MTPAAVLFDAGATLLHADPPVEDVYIRAFREDGATAGRGEILAALGRTWADVRAKKFVDRYGGIVGERAFWQAFVERARSYIDGGAVSPACFQKMVDHFLEPRSWSVYPDVRGALADLRSSGIPLAIVSNWDSTLPSLLEAHGLAESFSAVCVSAIEATGKPGLEIFHRACAKLGVSPADAVHVGDSIEEDFEAARRAGLTAVLLDRSGRHPNVSPRVTDLGGLSEAIART